MEGGTVLRSSSTLTRPSNFAAKSTVFATQRHDFVSFRTKSSPSTNGWIKTPAAVASAPHRLTGFLTSAGFGRGVVSASLTAASGVNSVRVSVRDGKKENPIIVIDNYDSFTYNLCQEKSKRHSYFPRTWYTSRFRDIIANSFGTWPYYTFIWSMHGLTVHWGGFWSPFTAGRYHSLVIENDSFPNEALEITAWTEDGLVMAARHRKYKHIQGVQFHPESIITTEGKEVVRNFLKLIDRMEAGYIFVQP
ncbi:anthranilate synthase beta subunit 1, chloroplastic-like isoform X2 [Magnolia sinica]|uniref:anthranilate synthase beta subunit 1, chloroplastic-like isoform X2 n=1 Tax=Magnolia sinica TaxID=86752 RepID=UPI002657AC49|nr:anthranilate synthase beta subunit 1, chloroplastic-like isoform X2 [Magnolia sinica]